MFLLALLPVLQLLPMWTLLADRFLLVPSVGLAILVAAIGAAVPDAKRPLLMLTTAAGVLVYAGGLYVERARFADDTRFWAYAVETVPDAALSHHNLGIMMLRRGDAQRAVSHLERAYNLGRRHPLLYLHLAGALEGAGRVEDAEATARAAIEKDPDAGAPWAQLASLQRRRGDLEGAARSLEEAGRRRCPEATFLRQQAPLLAAQGKLDEALRAYRRLTELVPADPSARVARDQLAAKLGR
jgi:tetratricopeptide (TPR) repeat protein